MSYCIERPIRYKGKTGRTIYMHPDYINLILDKGGIHSMVPYEAVEFLDVKNIDTTKPLQVPDLDKEVIFITETSDGNLLVDVQSYGWAIFDKQGKFIRAKDGYGYSSGLINKPEKRVKYHAVHKNGSVMISSGFTTPSAAWEFNPQASQLVQIDMIDGEVSGVSVLKRS
ncbi:MAG: hypothetical protein ABW128_16975 [Rhizorhabdus sp.]